MGGDHPCPVCKATFTRPQHVARHMRSHTGDRPYKCQQCGDQFARSDLLSRHVNKCHSNNPPTASGRGKGAAANQELDDKRRACDQCNHSKVRCDFGIPCGKCIQRKTICTYAKPPKKTMGKKDDGYGSNVSTSTTSSLYDVPGTHMPGMSMPSGVPLHYLHPSGAVPNEFGFQQNNHALFGGLGAEFMQAQAPRNLYDSPSPNAPSLTMSASTLESAGSSPDTQHFATSTHNSAKGNRPRSLTVPTHGMQYPQHMYGVNPSGAQFGVPDNNAQRPSTGPMPYQYNNGSGLTASNVSNLPQSMSIPSNWPMMEQTASFAPGITTNAQHARSHSTASSMDASSLSNWNGSSGTAANTGIAYPMVNDNGLNARVNPMGSIMTNNAYPTLDMNFLDDYGRPATAASDGGFATALNGLTLHDSELYENSIYEQYMNTVAPATIPESMPTGQTPDIWAAFMSEPFSENTPTAESLPANGAPAHPSPLKNFRPQLLTRLSKSNSMPNLMTPLGSGATPRAYPQVEDNKKQLAPPPTDTPSRMAKPPIPPTLAEAESLKSYQQACLARAAPVLKFSPKVKGNSPVADKHERSPHLATTLGIQAASPATSRGRSTSIASSSSTSTATGRLPVVSQRSPQQNGMPYPYLQTQQPRPGSNLRPPGMAAFPTLSPHTRFLSQSLLAANVPQRPSNKRLPSTTLGPDNAKRTLFHNLGDEEGDHEFALFDDDAEFFQLQPPEASLLRRRRSSAPSISPPTVHSSSASSSSDHSHEPSPGMTIRPRVISDATPFQPSRAPQLVNRVR